MEDNSFHQTSLETADREYRRHDLSERLSTEGSYVGLELRRGHLIQSQLSKKQFINCRLENLHLFDSEFCHCVFIDTTISQSQLAKLRFQNCTFLRSSFEGCLVEDLSFLACYVEESSVEINTPNVHRSGIIRPEGPEQRKTKPLASDAKTEAGPTPSPSAQQQGSPPASGRFGNLEVNTHDRE